MTFDVFASDAAFDQQLPASLLVKSAMHFTPLAVARAAAELLAPRPGMVVLDVGAGIGKFCLAAAAILPAVKFVGVEWRPGLVDVATSLARKLALTNATFLHADAFAIDWTPYDAFYFFNPFAEQLLESVFSLDHSRPTDPAIFNDQVHQTQRRLADAPVGTRVVTCDGFGDQFPPGYALITETAVGPDRVELWIKTERITRVIR